MWPHLICKNVRPRFKFTTSDHFRYLSQVSKDGNGTLDTFKYNKLLSLELPKRRGRLQVHEIWLRHHCQCEKCFNQKTYQRIRIPSDLPLISTIIDATVKDNNDLNVLWNDGHISKFHIDWLQNNVPKSLSEAPPFQNPFLSNRPTNNDHFDTLFKNLNIEQLRSPVEKAIQYNDFMKDGNEGIAQLLTNILTYGYGIVIQCPPSFDATKEVILKVSHVQNTIYGDFSEWTSNLAHADTAYTSDIVHMHTDTSYFTEPIGLQIFHCLKHEGSGGINSLVDGFHIAKKMARLSREQYEILASIPVPSQYIDLQKHHFYSRDVTFGHDSVSGMIQKIRYNPHDMAILKDLPYEIVDKFYKALVSLSDLVERSPQTIKFEPGLIIFLDNWRVMHGRSAFTGFRHLCGAYISRSDWLSRARTLGVLKDF